jgi:hypothetical protein
MGALGMLGAIIGASCFWVESKRDAQIGRLCSSLAGDGNRQVPSQIAFETERATVERDFYVDFSAEFA